MSHEAFFAALHTGNAERVAAHLDADPALLTATSPSGLSPVLFATYYRQPALAQLLIERGAPLTAFEAAATGHAEVLQPLLDADPRLVAAFSADGFTLLGLAAFFGQVEVARALIARGADVNVASRNGLQVTPLHSAVAGRHADLAALLLDAGADVNARQHGGFTPLMGAAQNGHADLVRALLARGADPAARTDDGDSAAVFARDWSDPALRELLP
ncbi:ankyrin repeat domain-containing protein [Deinococcus maricopensis]|uniref:Ankyrin n=1 Tax=Deinococcus maricopensis (strain DSM 21211 / LMG 22137 / NRRL B-23946 / LB-34) TaxID=709986 RepID=E8UA04_DEIML|nr:ankyrin repeat domain-containing protein [Deinococcus maricopensis]ADV67893.1 Ankyrin [Deinococcus maricopensis DSM 21211]